MLRQIPRLTDTAPQKTAVFQTIPRPDISKLVKTQGLTVTETEKKIKAAKDKLEKAMAESITQEKKHKKYKYICWCGDHNCGIGPMDIRVECN